MNKFTQTGLAALAAIGSATAANGVVLTTGEPQINENGVRLYLTIDNPSEGTYDVASHDFYKGVADAGLNQNVTIANGAPADNFTGWTLQLNNGDVDLTNNGGELFGSPTYTVWDTETMGNNSFIANADLETNGIPGYQPFSITDLQSGSYDSTMFDTTIFKSDNAVFDTDLSGIVNGTPNIQYSGSVNFGEQGTFTATSPSGFNTFQSQAANYHAVRSDAFAAIPEPSSTGLLIPALTLAYAATRRRK